MSITSVSQRKKEERQIQMVEPFVELLALLPLYDPAYSGSLPADQMSAAQNQIMDESEWRTHALVAALKLWEFSVPASTDRKAAYVVLSAFLKCLTEGKIFTAERLQDEGTGMGEGLVEATKAMGTPSIVMSRDVYRETTVALRQLINESPIYDLDEEEGGVDPEDEGGGNPAADVMPTDPGSESDDEID